MHKEGSFLIVSIEKPEMGQKGAAVKAHKKIPSGVTVHELELSKQGNKSSISTVVFLSLAIVLFCVFVYMST